MVHPHPMAKFWPGQPSAGASFQGGHPRRGCDDHRVDRLLPGLGRPSPAPSAPRCAPPVAALRHHRHGARTTPNRRVRCARASVRGKSCFSTRPAGISHTCGTCVGARCSGVRAPRRTWRIGWSKPVDVFSTKDNRPFRIKSRPRVLSCIANRGLARPRSPPDRG